MKTTATICAGVLAFGALTGAGSVFGPLQVRDCRRPLIGLRMARALEALGTKAVSTPAWENRDVLRLLQGLGRLEPQIPALSAGLRRDPLAVQARFTVVRALLEIEQRYASSRSLYPLDPAALDLPPDPYAPGMPLRYEPAEDGLGYRLWSVGRDGRDDGGLRGRDLLFERASQVTRQGLASGG